MNKEYNWWTDPKNKEEVERQSWWEHEPNKEYFPFPVSVVKDSGVWVATTNEETYKLIGDRLSACAGGKTKEEAIRKMFSMIKGMHDFVVERELSYRRWVPFIKGPWSSVGGRWFSIFGINFNFRYGKNMQGGWYIPFTKLNISVHSLWATYRRYKKAL